ncbi:MAG: NAD(P)/FAD-dependent oxidoreductase [Ardenticatenaceae bacterium]
MQAEQSHLTADVVICGAGIAGIATAYQLAVKEGIKRVLLVDPRPPLSLTSDQSTECYRNWWPGPDDAMIRLMNRSIDLLENLARESGNRFHLNRRGYLYATAQPAGIAALESGARQAARQGAGPLRYHTGRAGEEPYSPAPPHGFESQPTGADLILDKRLIGTHFPYLSGRTVAVLHTRRCGWLSAQQLGMYLWEQVRARGVRLISGEVQEVRQSGGRIVAVRIGERGGSSWVSTRIFIVAAGPYVREVARMLGIDLPIYAEQHVKIAFSDHLRIVPRDAPLLIWNDSVELGWSPEERAFLQQAESTRGLLETLPPGAHTRPEGGGHSDVLLLLWPYHTEPVAPTFPLTLAPHQPEIILRGVATMIPALARYLERMPKPVIDGGYYTRTRENRPLIGPLRPRGAYVIGALSGFGIMIAAGAAELLAAHITGASVPDYAPAFAVSRYDDPAYVEQLDSWGETGQL